MTVLRNLIKKFVIKAIEKIILMHHVEEYLIFNYIANI